MILVVIIGGWIAQSISFGLLVASGFAWAKRKGPS